MSNKRIKRLAAAVTACLAMSVSAPPAAFALNSETSSEPVLAAAAAQETAIRLGAERLDPAGSGVEVKDYAGKTGVIVTGESTDSLTFTFEVQQAGEYTVWFSYLPLTQSGLDVEFRLEIDGSAPVPDMEEIALQRFYKDDLEGRDSFKTDAQGNELTPEQVDYDAFMVRPAMDSTGVQVDPYSFTFSEGTHTLSLREISEPFALEYIELRTPEQPPAYEKPAVQMEQGTPNETITLPAEYASAKSQSSLVPKSDKASASLSPSSYDRIKLNYIGGSTWSKPGEQLVWQFYVRKSGYYKIGFNYKQSDVMNGESLRWLRIDGKTPIQEVKNLSFSYTTSWKFKEFASEDGQAYWIWLDEGEHELSLEVTLGYIAEYFGRLQEIVERLGDEYTQIIRITGDTPDVNRDYELFNQIPDFSQNLTQNRDALLALADDMSGLSDGRGDQYTASMKNMARVLNNMIEKPYYAHQYVKDYYSCYTGLSSWLYEMINMPLRLDEVQIVPYGVDFNQTKAGFFESIAFSVKRFFYSFVRDYQAVGTTQGSGDGESLKLWVNWGQDQALALNTLISDSFTEQTGIQVNLQVTNASLINGLLAGNFPDIVLNLARTEPVNLGMRGALYDLKQFDDYADVLGRFQESAVTPYLYGDACYALPDTQNFYCMFYRKDILESLGLEVPQTWDEFIDAATVLQRNNMEIYIPYTQIANAYTINTGIGGLNLYATLMFQNGLSIYNEEHTATQINTPQAIEVFDNWTRLYTDYKYIKEADFYNRFRVGTMPLGIALYTTYTTLYSAAPEIRGRWGVALVPGVTADHHAVAGSGTGCGIVKRSENIPAAWEFLKWWTSADTQKRYSQNMEALQGMIGRPAVSNQEAFQALTWEREDLAVLMEQWEQVEEVPEIPGSYYVSRAIDQAYWSVINDGKSSTDTIMKWSQVADEEIRRKISEYS